MTRRGLSSAIVGSCMCGALMSGAIAGTVTRTYQADQSVFANPERGVLHSIVISPGATSADIASVMQRERTNNFETICQAYFMADNFKNGPIPQAYLNLVQDVFSQARTAGAKIQVRWSYTFDYPDGVDPSFQVILGHVQQLKPIFHANSDVLAFIDCGFCGPWGEQHTTPVPNSQSNFGTLLSAILDAIRADRMAAVRYNTYKRLCLNSHEPLARADAFNGSSRARVGHCNDCLLANGVGGHDEGTYSSRWSNDPHAGDISWQKNFLHWDNLYVPQTGESCGSCNGCSAADVFAELKRMRWDCIDNNNVNTTAMLHSNSADWATFNRLLGYRFEAVDATMPDSVRPGGQLQVALKVHNVGWGKLFNPHRLEIILRPRGQTGQQGWRVVSEVDPRLWSPDDWSPDEPAAPGLWSETIRAGIPTTGMAAGAYDILVNLPDTGSRIHDDSRYSIRLANTNMWEAATGYNSLQHSIIIDPAASGPTYSGTSVFTRLGQSVAVVPAGDSRSDRRSLRVSCDSRGTLTAYLSSDERTRVQVRDACGRLAYSTWAIGRLVLPVSKFAPGLYVVQETGNGFERSARISIFR